MNVSELAKKLNTKTDLLINRLRLIGIEVTSSSRLDELTILKATLILIDNPRVEDLAKTLHLSVDKVIDKLSAMGIFALSNLSIINQNDLVRFLKAKNFSELISNKTIKKSIKSKASTKKKTKKKKAEGKQKRVFEIADELNISERALIKMLEEMHVFAIHRRSPVDDQTIEKIRSEIDLSKQKSNVLKARLARMVSPVTALIKSAWSSIAFTSVLVILTTAFLFSSSAFMFIKAKNYPSWKLGKLQMPQVEQTNVLMKTIGILEIHKTDRNLPVSEEGAYVSGLSPTLIHLKKSPLPGGQGVTILTDSTGSTYQAFKDLVPGDILIIRLANENRFYYKLATGNVLNAVVRLPLRSGLLIKIKTSGKTFEFKGILQKKD